MKKWLIAFVISFILLLVLSPTEIVWIPIVALIGEVFWLFGIIINKGIKSTREQTNKKWAKRLDDIEEIRKKKQG